MKTWALVAVAAMGLTACQNDFEEQVEAKDSVVVTFVADSADTRTSVNTEGDTPLFAWGESESFKVLEQTDALAEATSVTFEKVDGKAHISATFDANEGKDEYKYVTVYPESGYVSAESISAATLTLPAEQTMVDGSYDPNADLMVSEVKTVTAQPTEAQMVGFHRIAAVVKMSISNLAIGAGEQIEKVEFTANGKQLAGQIVVDLNDPATIISGAGSSSVSVATTASDVVYFTVLPTTLEAGDTYSVAVVTNKYLYIKQGTIPEGKSLAFESGKVTRFGVNMADVEAIDKWTLVRDASTLKEGDVVAIVAKDYDKALSTKLHSNASETSTSAKRGLADVVKMGNFLKGGEDLQQLTLMTGIADGTFSFYDKARGKFLVSTTTSSTYLINQVYCDVNTSFKITIDNATTAATITNTEGVYAGNLLRYNTNGYFVSNQNTSSVYKDVCIYRLEGAEGEVPVVAAVVTVPAADKPIVIAEEGATEATAIDAVVFNYVGDWNIEVNDNAEWLSFAYDAEKNKLYYTAELNTGAKRDAVATITASMEGQESLTWTFNVVQKSAPQEITIEEFLTKKQDYNTTYKLTGKLVTIPASVNDAFVLEDENGKQAQIKYLKLSDGKTQALNNVDLKVGDIVTVTTVVTSSTASSGGGNSSYPSIYKGHYRLTATADKSLVGYEGDTANITVAVEQSGNISLPEDGVIKGAMAEAYDFVTFNYTDDATTATATFAENTGSSRNAVFNFTYGLASVSVSIGQQNHPSVKVGWFLVTDLSELAAGDKVIIAGKNPDETLDYAIKKYTSSSASSTSGIAITLQGNAISSVEGVEQFTLENGLNDYPGTWAFKCDSYSRYIYPNSSSIKIKSDLDKNGCWAIEIAADGKVTLTSQIGSSSSTKNTMMMNYTTSNQTFGAYTAATTGKGAIYIYKYYN